MHRIDTPTADPDANGTGKAGFRAGNVTSGLASTRLDDDFFNAVQEEPALAIEGFGDTLVKGTNTQLLALLKRQALKAALGCMGVGEDFGSGVLRSIAKRGDTGTGPGRVVAVGEAGLIIQSNGYDNFSAAGTIGAGYTDDFLDVVYDSALALWIACGKSSEIQTSPDGDEWTEQWATGTSEHNSIATDGAGHLVVVGSGEIIRRSSNGVTWVTPTGPFPGTPDIVSVAYGLNDNDVGTFVCLTATGMAAFSITNGATWTLSTTLGSALSSSAGAKVGYDVSLGFVIHHLTNVYRSVDGDTWTQIHNAVGTSSENPGLLVTPYCWTLGYGGTDGIMLESRYSPTMVNAQPSFRMEHKIDGAPSCWRFSAGQLLAVRGSKVYVGGVL